MLSHGLITTGHGRDWTNFLYLLLGRLIFRIVVRKDCLGYVRIIFLSYWIVGVFMGVASILSLKICG